MSEMAKRVFQENANDWSILQTSYKNLNVQAYDNGLVRAAIAAYSQHHNLIIRPDDVWTAILTQFSTYVNKHAEELRGQFVAHKGQKHLVLYYNADSRHDFDFGIFAKDMGRLLEEEIRDPSLRDWIVPDFTTTTRNDVVVASITMMSTLQAYFTYECCLMCGIPSVTLLGEKSDWERILKRIDRLEDFGDEPKLFAKALRAVISRFVSSFDAPDSDETKEFWQLIADKRPGGSGPSYYTGWITAFCFWDAEGDLMINSNGTGLILDGARFPSVDTENVPPGWCQVPVKVTENGTSIETVMVAGSMSIDKPVDVTVDENRKEKRRCDTLQPSIGWIMFEQGTGNGVKQSAETKSRPGYRDPFGSRLGPDESPWCGPSGGGGCWGGRDDDSDSGFLF